VRSSHGRQVTERLKKDILIVCVGNGLAGDDGVGQAIYEELRREPLPASSELIHLGLGGMALYDHFRGQRLLLVIDAVQLDAEPGHIHVLDWDRLPALSGQAVSLHGVGLSETLCIAGVLDPDLVPERTVLVGIEGRRFNDLGVPLSPEVAAAVDAAVQEVKRQINCMQGVEAIP
jgi:hydrogenase maturation protease